MAGFEADRERRCVDISLLEIRLGGVCIGSDYLSFYICIKEEV